MAGSSTGTPNLAVGVSYVEGNGARVQLWNAASHDVVASIWIDFSMTDVSLSPDGRLLAVVGQGVTRVWDVSVAGGAVERLRLPTPGGVVTDARFVGPGLLVTAGGDAPCDQSLRLWDVGTDAASAVELAALPPADDSVQGRALTAVASGPGIVVSTSTSGTELWGMASGSFQPVDLPVGVADALRDGAIVEAVSPDGSYLVTRQIDASGEFFRSSVWNISDPARARVIDMLPGDVGGLRPVPAFSPDSTRLVSADGEGRLHLTEVVGGEAYPLAEIPGPGEYMTELAFTGDGLVAVGLFTGDVVLWNVSSTEPAAAGVLAKPRLDP